MSKRLTITCKNCGWEYMPGEIFIPKSFVGAPVFVDRDVDGKIVDAVGDMDLSTRYICDKCGIKMYITAKVQFSVNMEEKFEEEYTLNIPKKDLILEED